MCNDGIAPQIVRTEVNVWPIGKIVDPDVKHRKIVLKIFQRADRRHQGVERVAHGSCHDKARQDAEAVCIRGVRTSRPATSARNAIRSANRFYGAKNEAPSGCYNGRLPKFSIDALSRME
jgi:hypothetical protein